MIHVPQGLRLLYLVASVVIAAIVLFAMSRLHSSHGIVGQRQAPRAAMLGLLATLFVAGMNFVIYTVVPENVGGSLLATFVAVGHIRNVTVYVACALDAAAFISLFGGWRLRTRKGRAASWPRLAPPAPGEGLSSNLDLDDTGSLPPRARVPAPPVRH